MEPTPLYSEKKVCKVLESIGQISELIGLTSEFDSEAAVAFTLQPHLPSSLLRIL